MKGWSSQEWVKEVEKRRKDRLERRRLQRVYGLTPQGVIDMARKQNYRCAICRQKKRLVIDHDHKTGLVRGLLCHRCNTCLAWLEDTSKKRIVKYLKGE